jgi:hypothetical protein
MALLIQDHGQKGKVHQGISKTSGAAGTAELGFAR